jgi:peroxiredoxin
MRSTILIPALTLALAGVGCDEPEAEEAGETTAAATETPAAEEAPEEPAAEEEAEAPAVATVGQPAPGFTLTDQAGTEHTLSDLRGKIVVLEWINPQCPYVQRHYGVGTMTGLDGQFPDDEVAWLAIDSSHFVTAEDAEAWRQEHEIAYPILLDGSGEVGHAYNATTTPNMFVIDADGVLRYAGAIDDDPRGRNDSPTNYVNQAVQALRNGEAVETAQTEPYGCSVKYENS